MADNYSSLRSKSIEVEFKLALLGYFLDDGYRYRPTFDKVLAL